MLTITEIPTQNTQQHPTNRNIYINLMQQFTQNLPYHQQTLRVLNRTSRDTKLCL